MDTALVKSRIEKSGKDMQIIRLNITMPKRLKIAGEQKAASRCISNFSAYIQELMRIDCGFCVPIQRMDK
jgi:hypothetical protein